VAVNLAGIEADALHRGNVVAFPGALKSTTALDVQVEVLPDAPRPLKNRAWVRFYVGTQEVLGKVVLLEADEVRPGGSGLAQILLDEPTVARRQDRFVLRNATAEFTVGGGTVLDTDPPKHRRKDERVVEILMYKGEGEHVNLLLAQFMQSPLKVFSAAELTHALKLERSEIDLLLAALTEQKEIAAVERGWLLGTTWRLLVDKLLTLLASLQQAGPHRVGWKRDELTKMFLDHPNKLVEAILLGLAQRGDVVEKDGRYSLKGHEARLTTEPQQAMLARMLAEIRKTEFAPPSIDEVKLALNPDPRLFRLVQEHMQETGMIQYISKDIYFLSATLEQVRTKLSDFVSQHGSVTPAQVRDLLGTTRKYVIPLLEYLDQSGFTRRQGDTRVIAHA
jgi:selenocysteine-specific elongation factor